MNVDLCFLIDCTGSMESWIEQCKKDIQNIVSEIKKEFSYVDINLACVGYRDYEDTQPFEVLGFTKDISKFKVFVGALKATGGGDQCEDVLGGLEKCVGLTWTAEVKVLFHIADAPPHNRKYHDGAVDSYLDDRRRDHVVLLKQLQQKGNMRYYIGKLNTSVDKMIKVFKATGNDINMIVEEHNMPDVKLLLENVVKSVTHAIRAIKVVKNPRKNLNPGHIIPKPKKHKFDAYVGIDFGTDGTGFAFTFADDKRPTTGAKNNIYTEQKWKGASLAELKNKTNLLLDKNGNFVAFGQEATDLYTSTTDKTMEYYERFKMSLYDKTLAEIQENKDEKTEGVELVPYLTAANGAKRKSLEVLVQTFKFLKDHIMNVAMNKYTDKIEHIQWIVTVPAIWSNNAKARMREAITEAGLIDPSIPEHLIFALEPECAGVVMVEQSDLKQGDKYVLLDLGGGTADIACHIVSSGVNVSQICAPSGGPWGSTYVDEAFVKLLREIFGEKMVNGFQEKFPKQFIRLKETFRKAKQQYDPSAKEAPPVVIDDFVEYMGDNGTEMDLACEMTRDYKLHGKSEVIKLDECDATLILGHDGWKYLLDTVVSPLINHVIELFSMKKELKDCETMFCVGGLSTSPYVVQKLRETFLSKKVVKRLIAPPRPILTVVEGAAKYGQSPTLIEGYVLRHTYGLKCMRKWQPADGAKNKLWDPEAKEFVFEDGFEIFAKKDKRLTIHSPPEVKYFQPANKGDLEVAIQIHSSDEENPERCSEDTFCAEGTFKLPSDWWSSLDAADKSIPVLFYFNKSEIQVKVDLEHYPDDKRLIKIDWIKET